MMRKARLVAASLDESCHPLPKTEECDVIIVGAGVSGLSCAYHLKRLAPELKVIVLEASDRMGGRVKTIKMGNAPVDLGGAWIHGVENNQLTEFVKNVAGLTFAPDDPPESIVAETPSPYCRSDLSDSSRFVAWDSTDGRIYPNSIIESVFGGGEEKTEAEKKSESLEEKLRAAVFAESERLRVSGESDRSVSDVIGHILKSKEWKSELDAIGAQCGAGKARTLLNSAIQVFEGYNATPLHTLSTKWLTDGGFEEGGDKLTLNGMSALVDFLSRGIDVRLQHTVSAIDCTRSLGRKAVVVSTSDTEFVASQVVVSVSLGILKSRSIIFKPDLPSRKQRSINRMGFNVLDKVILRFSTRFWPKNVEWMVCASDALVDCSWFLSLYETYGEPILVAFVSPVQSARNHSLPGGDAAIVDFYLSQLEKPFGRCVRELLVESHCTHWKSDPYTLGSYSGYVVGCTGEDWDIMSESVNDGLIGFAGEHTRRTHIGTIDAAALSGLREAKRIAASVVRSRAKL
eukprot:TRINITY_DN7338_c0_g1_i1.p1 TRINITY_DN7338_c0_g1~~TRINITY_DN7338_c0_g1_i1.p1  ORF type:complete len:516 (-),score=80.44 TRINITY_DN7338_c0_g1_i1:253-1800(-)